MRQQCRLPSWPLAFVQPCAANWADPETFYRQTIASGGFPQRVSLNLGEVLTAKGKAREAEAVLRKTVAEFPDYPAARIQLGTILIAQGRKSEAEPFLTFGPKAADQPSTTPQSWRAALDLSALRYNAHKPAEAVTILDEAARRYPDVWELIQYRAEILQVSKGVDAALPAVEAFVSRNWWHIDSRLTLARLHTAAQDYPAAVADCNEAATLDVHSPVAFEQAAKAHIMAHELPQALEAQATAITRGPAQSGQYMVLAAILGQMHEPRRAMAAAREAELLRASNAEGRV